VDFDVEKTGDVAFVILSEETLEASNLDDFRDSLGPLLEQNDRVVFDLSQVRFIDSMACGLFLSFLKQLQQKGGGLKICCTTASVRNLFKLMGFDKLFGLAETREDAAKEFGQAVGGSKSKVRKNR